MDRGLRFDLKLVEDRYRIRMDFEGIDYGSLRSMLGDIRDSGIMMLDSQDEITLRIYEIASEYGFGTDEVEVRFRGPGTRPI